MSDTGPPFNLPFPLGTDLVIDGAQAIEDLATAVAATLDVVQVVRSADPSQVAFPSSESDLLTVSITPKDADSTILVTAEAAYTFLNGSAGSAGGGYKVTRSDNSVLVGGEQFVGLEVFDVPGVLFSGRVTVSGTDAPATTATQTYKLRAAQTAGGGTSDGVSLIAYELKA